MLFMKKIVLAAVMAVSVGGASAQSMYLGGSVGEANFSADCAGSTKCDQGGSGYKVYGGYRLHKNLAVEAGFASFGSANAEGEVDGVGSVRAKFRSQGVFLAGAVRAPLGDDATAVARLGIMHVKTKAIVDLLDLDSSGSTTERSVKPMFGLGLEMSVTKNVQARLDIDFTSSADIDDESGTLRMISAGIQASF